MTVKVGAFGKLTDFLHSPGDLQPDLVELSWHGCFPSLESSHLLRLVEVKERVVAAPQDKKRAIPKLDIKLFGRFEVLRDGEPIPDEAWGRRKTKTLLKVLLTEPGRVFTQDQLIDALFGGENVANATQNLYSRVSQLRRALEPGLKRGVDSTLVLREGQGYRFNAGDTCEIDTMQVDHFLESARAHVEHGEYLAATDLYRNALSISAAAPFTEDQYEDWALIPRQEWTQRRIEAYVGLAEAYSHAGEAASAAEACQSAFDMQPWREAVMRKLMQYYAAAGQHAEALETYRRGRQAVSEVLNAELSAESISLNEQLAASSQGGASSSRHGHRIAILPLVNSSAEDSDQYLADGITEELIHSLSRIREIGVIAQTSVFAYRNTRKTIAQIGRELQVTSAVEGSVRRTGKKLRVVVSLADTSNEEQLWTRSYDRPVRDIFAVQEEIAEDIARQLRVVLRSSVRRQLRQPPTEHLEAYSNLLKGRFHASQRTEEAMRLSMEYYRQALALDPNFALAHEELAESYLIALWVDSSISNERRQELYDLVDTSLNAALRIDEDLSEAHSTLALLKAHRDWDWDGAESLLEEVVQMNPGNAIAQQRYAMLLHWRGRFDKAASVYRKAASIDPLSMSVFTGLANALLCATRYAEAIDVLDKAEEIDFAFPGIKTLRAYARTAQGDFIEALEDAHKEVRSARDPDWELLEAAIRRELGDTNAVEAVVESLRTRSEEQYIWPAYVAYGYLLLGKRDRVFEYLEKAFEVRDFVLVSWMTDPVLDIFCEGITSDKRFQSLRDRIGL